jgi:hypothetical protein
MFIPRVLGEPTDDTIRVGFAKKLKICRQCLLNLSIVADDFSHRSHYIYISVLWKLLAVKISVKQQMELKK